MADAKTPVLTDEQIDAAVEAWFANLDDGQPHSFRGRMRCAVLAAQAPAQPAEAVGTLSIQRFRGHLENASFDYTGALPDGDYALYTRPAPSQPGRAVMQQALDAIAPRFRSGNAVPVDKAMVPAAEWHALVAALSATMEKPNA